MIPFEYDWDIINWLSEKSGHPHSPYSYAVLRGGVLFHHQESQTFKACVELAKRLHDEPELARRLLHHGNWRNYVIGNVVAVLNRDSRYGQDYLEKLTLEGGPFLGALAAGWLIINTGETVPAMETYLTEIGNHIEISQDTIKYGSVLVIYAALRILNSQAAINFETTPLFEVLRTSSYFEREVSNTERCYTAYQLYPPIRENSASSI